MQELVQFELTKEFVERFQQALDERDQKFIVQSLEDIKAADISALLYEFNSEESKYVLGLLAPDIQAEIVNDLDEDTRKNFLKIYEPSQITTIVNYLNSDDAADILKMTSRTVQRFLEKLVTDRKIVKTAHGRSTRYRFLKQGR